MRLKRPNAVQTRRQIACVKEFETYFLPQCIIYRSCKNILDKFKTLVCEYRLHSIYEKAPICYLVLVPDFKF